MALRHSGTSCDTTCSLGDAHRVMHSVVTRYSTVRPLSDALETAATESFDAAAGRSGLRGETANAVADCNRARKTLPVVGCVTYRTIHVSGCGSRTKSQSR